MNPRTLARASRLAGLGLGVAAGLFCILWIGFIGRNMAFGTAIDDPKNFIIVMLNGITAAGLMVKQFGYYFDGLALGYAVLTKRKSQQGFIQTVGGAEQNLKLAEGYARKLGATACTRRPFR